MGSTTVNGLSVDTGAHLLIEHFERTRALVVELGLGDRWYEVAAGPGGGVLHAHELQSFSPKRALDVLRYRGLSLAGRIRLLLAFLEVHRHRGELDFFDLSVGDDALDQEDCDTFARRKLGDEVTDYIVDCFIRTFHFHGAHKMSVKYFEALCALLLEKGEFQECALRGGMQVLPQALAARLAIRYQTPVTGVEARDDAVALDAAGGRELYDAVVVATPAEVARTLLRAPSAAQQTLLSHAASSQTVLCAYAVPNELAGSFDGIWIPFVESPIVSGMASDRGLLDRDLTQTVFSVWLHEETARAWWEGSDAEILHKTAAEIGRLFPRYADQLSPLYLKRWPHALPIYGVGQVSRVRAFWAHGQGERGVFLCGDYLNHPWVEGAVRCGEKVAGLVHARPPT
jgi:protoporphyrinogen oxidase